MSPDTGLEYGNLIEDIC